MIIKDDKVFMFATFNLGNSYCYEFIHYTSNRLFAVEY